MTGAVLLATEARVDLRDGRDAMFYTVARCQDVFAAALTAEESFV
jgi:hypothetical protein